MPNDGVLVHGVMFEFPLTERKHLDKAEGLGYGYDQKDDVQILCSRTANTFVASTYIALTDQMDATLKPYDWYHALVLARAEEHGLPDDHLELLRSNEFIPDTDRRRDALIA